MAGTKDFIFKPQDLYNLLVHYTSGACPLSGEVREFLVHPHLTRKIALAVRSHEWNQIDPLQIGYDGKRVMSWTTGGGDVQWDQRNETPRRQ